MKQHLLVFLAVILLAGCTMVKDEKPKKMIVELTDAWEFKSITEDNWMPASVPGTVHTDLLANGVIPDPFYGTNEKELQWIDKIDWEYRCTFQVDPQMMAKTNIELLFEGLDTYAEVFLNEKPLLEADNMFRSWRVDCKDRLRKGKNELRIFLKSPIRIGLAKLEANGYPLPASNDQSENGGLGEKKVSIFTRKAGYHFGWDWGPRFVTSGIWRTVKLVGYDAARITDVHIEQLSLDTAHAKLVAHVEVESDQPFSGKIPIRIEGKLIEEKKVNIRKGQQVVDIPFEIPDPERWWPNGLGEPHLYTFTTLLKNSSDPRKPVVDEKSVRIGLRTIELVREKDEYGESFYFRVNGNPVFAKGANYIPNDVFLPRCTPDDYRRIVKAAADANMNMLRVWGGGIYENDLFYDLCDEYGILVWQDFMYACSMYPGDDDFLDNARIEAEENIIRLRNHPSLALWCGNNEIEVAWAEYEEDRGWGWKERYTPEQRKEIWSSYDTLFHQLLPAAVAKYDPHTAYWHSSPSAGMGNLASYENTSGDMHYWGVWHGQHPFTDFRKYRARFMSEYGFQSFPELNTVSAYAPPEQWDIESEVMAAHQRSGIGNLRIRQYMEEDYVIPEKFEHFLYVSQLLQAEGIRTAIESHRTDMPYCMGSLYWQLNDCWPVASWSGVDYFGRWKVLHYFVKKAFEETILTAFEEAGKISLHAISDKLTEQEGTLHITLIDFKGQVLWEKEKEIILPANGSKRLEQIDPEEFSDKWNPAVTVLVSSLQILGARTYENIYYFSKPKELELPAADLKVDIRELHDHFEIRLSSPVLVKNIFLSTSISTDHFSDNGFDLLPGTTKTVTFPRVSDRTEFSEKLKVIHLKDTF